jgi:hypothetical protein
VFGNNHYTNGVDDAFDWSALRRLRRRL